MTKLRISGISHDLRGVAHHEGRVWFVDGALPDEDVDVGEIRSFPNRVEAELLKVENASPSRVHPACEYFKECGGCSLQHVDHAGQIALKHQVLLEQLKRIAGIQPEAVHPAIVADPWHYRRRARLSIRWLSDTKHLALGFRHRKGQQIVEMAHCDVLDPALETVILPLRKCLAGWCHPSRLGHVDLVLEQGIVHVGLRILSEPLQQDIDSLLALARECSLSIFLDKGAGGDVSFLDGCVEPASGFSPGDFLQSNAVINAALVSSVVDEIKAASGTRLLEAFCGLGNFTFALAGYVDQITALEIDPGMVARAQGLCSQHGVTNVSFVADNLASSLNLSRMSGFDKILIDPPRQGASFFCENVLLKDVNRLIYVSCNPSTLARDAAILCKRGFKLTTIRLVDMFPQTFHIEAIAVFVPQPDAKIVRNHEKSLPKGRRIKPFSIR